MVPVLDGDIEIVVGYEDLDADVVGAGIEMLLNPLDRDVYVTAGDDPID